MFASLVSLSLATSFFAGVGAIDLDVNSQDSIKNTAKTLAGGIASLYKENLKDERIPGLFSDPYYWWEAGAAMGSLVDYSHLTGDNQYDDLVAEGIVFQIGDFDAFMPANQTKSLGNDDQATWAQTAMSAAENGFSTSKLGDRKWVDLAVNVFNTQVERWDAESCDGGLRWQIYQFNNGYAWKDTTTNGNFFLLAARLAKMTGNTTYSEWAEKAYKWSTDVGLITDEFQVYAGSDASNDCANINHLQWSYSTALYTEGAAIMWNITNGDEKWKSALTGLANSTSTFTNNDVLYEVACERVNKCNIDQKSFKGLAARSLARAAISAPFINGLITPLLQASAKGAAKGCSGTDLKLKCSLNWSGSGNTTDSGLSETLSALEVVQGLLVLQAKAATPVNSGASPSGTASPSPSSSSNGTAAPVQNENAGFAVGVSSTFIIGAAALAIICL